MRKTRKWAAMLLTVLLLLNTVLPGAVYAEVPADTAGNPGQDCTVTAELIEEETETEEAIVSEDEAILEAAEGEETAPEEAEAAWEEELLPQDNPVAEPKVIPMGTEVSIGSDETTVTIGADVDLAAGDTFIVYLETLPLAYRALAVEKQDGNTIVTAEKAEASDDMNLESEGALPLNEENSEFIPSEELLELDESCDAADSSKGGLLNPDPSKWGYKILMFEYKDGKLTIDRGKFAVELSDMKIPHYVSENYSRVAFRAKWNLKLKEEIELDSIDLGEIRIYGVGVVKLSLEVNVSLQASVGGTLEIGVEVSNSDGVEKRTLINNFVFAGPNDEITIDSSSLQTEARIEGALKVFAGLDILVLRGGFYGEVVVRTDYHEQVFYHENHPPVRCQDLRAYAFLRMGVEIVYIRPDFEEVELASNDFSGITEDNPFGVIPLHWENGERTYQGHCSQGMELPELKGDNPVVGYSGEIPATGILCTSVSIPYDMKTGDLTIAEGGDLEVKDHTLTIDGNLTIDGGNLHVFWGNIIVNGNLIVTRGYTENFGTITVNGDSFFGGISDNQEYYPTDEIRMYTSGFGCGEWITNGLLVTHMGPEQPFLNGNHLTLGGDWISGPLNLRGVVEQMGHTVRIEGDLHTDTKWDLQAGNVVVEENLYLDGNAFTLNGGHLQVGGNLICANEETGETGEISYKSGYGELYMKDPASVLEVDGDLITVQRICLEKGTVLLSGNLLQLSDYAQNNFTTDSECTLRFISARDPKTGRYLPTTHRVHCLIAGTRLKTLAVDPEGILLVDRYFNSEKLLTDVTIQSENAILGDFAQSGKTVTVNGDITLSGDWYTGGGTARINDSLHHVRGKLFPDKGAIFIAGDYIAGENADDIPGPWWGPSLVMENPEDLVDIDGDFVLMSRGNPGLREGTLKLAGNLLETQNSGDGRFECPSYKNHLTVLDGAEPQTVTFAHASSRFNRLHLTQPLSEYAFTPESCWEKLTIDPQNAPLYRDMIQVTGHNLSVFEDAVIGLNYYVEIPEFLSGIGVIVKVSVGDGDPLYYNLDETEAFKTLKPDTASGRIYHMYNYKIPVRIAAAEMTDQVYLTVENADLQTFEISTSVQEYCETLLSDTTGAYDKYRAVVKAMLNYGACAQRYFDYRTDRPANAILPEAEQQVQLIPSRNLNDSYLEIMDPLTVDGEEMISYYGTSLLLQSGVTIRHYFLLSENADEAALSITRDGQELEIHKKGNLCYVDVSGIDRKKLGSSYLVNVNYGEEQGHIRYGVPHYLYKLYQDGRENSLLAELISALKRFGDAV